MHTTHTLSAAGVSAERKESRASSGARSYAAVGGNAGDIIAQAGAATGALSEREAEKDGHTQEVFKTELAETQYQETAQSTCWRRNKQIRRMAEADMHAEGIAEDEEEFMCAMLTDLLLAPAAAGLPPPRTPSTRADHAQVVWESTASKERLNAAAWAPQSKTAVVKQDAECCVCMEAEKTHSFIPCGHRCVCQTCADNIMATTKECPACRTVCVVVCKIFV